MVAKFLPTVATVIALLMSPALSADDLFPAGTMSKARGIESVLQSRSAPSLIYNPANLEQSLEGRETMATYSELGFVSVAQSYEHKQFDPVRVKVATPIASLGLVARPQSRGLVIGMYLFPAKRGGIEVRGMPRELGGAFVPLAVEKNDQILRTAWGGSYRLNDAWSVGASVFHSFESTEVNAAVLASNAPVISQSGKNNFFQGVVGTRYEADGVALAASYRSPLEKTYKGTQTVAGVTSAIGKRDYAPAVWSLGVSYAPNRFSAAAQANAKRWGDGRGHISEGVLAVDAADLNDIVEYGVETAYRFGALTLGVSYAELPSPWGDGKAAREGELAQPGVGFGIAEGVDRKSYGAFSRYGLGAGKVALGVTRTAGSRLVGDSGYNPGYYQAETVVVSGAVDYTF